MAARLALRRQPRGSAAVETAILMIVLIPLIMYTLFLEDLLAYKLDQEETVMSSAWDFANQDFRHVDRSKLQDQVTSSDMQTYWDHTSSWNTYSDPNYDAKDPDGPAGKGHHQALTAHACWIGAEEVSCKVDSLVGMGIAGEFNFLTSTLGKGGGQSTCEAELGVQNYFIPQKFMQWWAHVDMTEQKRWDGTNIHGNAPSDAYHFPQEKFSVLSDSWALGYIKTQPVDGAIGAGHDVGPLDPDKHPMSKLSEWESWVNIPYGSRKAKLKKAKDFAQAAIDKEFMKKIVLTDGPTGDDLDTLPLAWDESQAKKINDHYASGYQDQRQQDTANNRGSAFSASGDKTPEGW
jgi:hypothetical protein